MNAGPEPRSPMTFIILAATNQDIRNCESCQNCEDLLAPGMDLSLREIMSAAARDDPRALNNRTLWTCDGVIESSSYCQAGIDLQAVIGVLRRMALERGFVNKP